MAFGSLPLDPASRRVVLVLQQHDVERCLYERDAARDLLDPEINILQFPLDAEECLPPYLKNIIDADLFRPGSILIQSPFDYNIYEEMSFAPQHFALAKHFCFSQFCMYLGAREVSVEQIDLRSRSGISTMKVNGEYSGIQAQANAIDEELEKFSAQMTLYDEFQGGRPQFDIAEKILRQTRLIADPNMRTLLEMRRSVTNQITTRKLILNLSSEVKKNLNVAGRLNLPAFLNLSAQYNRIVNEQYDYSLTVRVKF